MKYYLFNDDIVFYALVKAENKERAIEVYQEQFWHLKKDEIDNLDLCEEIPRKRALREIEETLCRGKCKARKDIYDDEEHVILVDSRADI